MDAATMHGVPTFPLSCPPSPCLLFPSPVSRLLSPVSGSPSPVPPSPVPSSMMNPTRARFSTLWLTLLVSLLAALHSTHAASAPNIVIVLVDDMGVMDTSLPFLTDANGQPKKYPLNEYYRTPAMERLGARGIRFNNFCAMSVCSPTRTSIMTGQNAARHRVTNWINPEHDNAGPQG